MFQLPRFHDWDEIYFSALQIRLSLSTTVCGKVAKGFPRPCACWGWLGSWPVLLLLPCGISNTTSPLLPPASTRPTSHVAVAAPASEGRDLRIYRLKGFKFSLHPIHTVKNSVFGSLCICHIELQSQSQTKFWNTQRAKDAWSAT